MQEYYDTDEIIAPQKKEIRQHLWLLLLLVALGGLLGTILIVRVGSWKGFNFQDLLNTLGGNTTAENRNFVRFSMFLNHLTMFIMPALLYGLIIAGKKVMTFYKLNHPPRWETIGKGALWLFVAIPLVQYTYTINKALPLPDVLRMMESDTNEALKNLLIMDSPSEFIYNLLLMAIIPAIGEELVFRGGIQQYFHKIFSNPHLVIWLSAAIFSAFHVQFEGFIPRMILGALLGYLFYWSKNLWIPITAHFLNNGLQVLLQYLYAKNFSSVNLEDDIQVPVWAGLISLAIVVYMAQWVRSPKQTDHA
ncbi:MAG: CPBP family intramembrane metalloprotease [Saprospiraceae bacterium]|nr:CPBP family intramembrane metalloprotease [Saprospiraceae bacterium]MBP7699548.1 CPBP family intramembrane metalloprotease [Saprospiraceae bacterium]